jgi:hypothetical protein
MKYVRTVEAVQWNGEPMDGIQQDWDHYFGIHTGHIYMFAPGRYTKINPSDWIVTEEDGNKIVMDDKIFSKMFKPYYGKLPVDQEIASLYNRITELDNEVSYARFGGKSY